MLFIVVFYCYLTVNKVEYIINIASHRISISNRVFAAWKGKRDALRCTPTV